MRHSVRKTASIVPCISTAAPVSVHGTSHWGRIALQAIITLKTYLPDSVH